MSVSGIGISFANLYNYACKISKTDISKSDFTEQIQNTKETSDTSKLEAYQKYLESKYGNVTIKSVGKDQESLDKIAKTMRGDDVIIAPNIFEEMANDPQKAAYFEYKIDYFFNQLVPKETARCAAMGLDFQACGVVIHEDGTVTYICGCADSPERVKEVNKINKAKMEKKAKHQKEYFEHISEAAAKRRHDMNIYNIRFNMSELINNNSSNLFYVEKD